MERAQFAERLAAATEHAIQFARCHVTDDLQGEVRYLVEPNRSFDGHADENETLYPEDSIPMDEHLGPWNDEDVVDFLWRDGRVPEWIDIAVAKSDDTHVYLQLLCCGRFTASEDKLYYGKTGAAPFGVKSPNLPPGWTTESGKFDLHWSRNR